MRSSRSKVATLSVLALMLAAGGSANAITHAQSASAATASYSNWAASAYNFQNTNGDPQNVINVNNVSDLRLRWFYQIPVNPFNIPGAPPALGVETQPLVENGIVYIATPYNNIIALSTTTGAKIWNYQINMTKFIGESWWSGAYTISGISLYNETLYVMSSDTTVYAFNALNGTIDWTIPPVAANIAGNTGTYYGEKAPILVGDNLIVRASTTDYGGRGFVAAYNIHTRSLAWMWYSTPPSTGPIDTNWDSQDEVLLANGTTVNYGQPQGNITPYQGDWGTTSQSQFYAGGGAAWGLMAVNNKTGVIYFSTGHPSDGYDASLRPGPNLYTDCLVALNTTDGKMLWYYQMTSHDLTEHEGGWSVTLANATISGVNTPVVIQASKDNHVYVLNALTGKLVYSPIAVGAPALNNLNDGNTTTANLQASQSSLGNNQRICPGPDGGVEMSPAVVGNTLYVASQNGCGVMTAGPYPYKGQTINGYVYTGDSTAKQNGTVYAINLSNGQPIWHYNIPNRYQGSSAVVSGGVLYAIDRAGILYELNAATGALLSSYELGGLGAAGVSIAEDSNGNMMLFAPSGGGDLPNATPGVVTAFWLGQGTTTSGSGGPSTTTSSNIFGPGLEQPIIIALGVVVVVLAMYILVRRRAPTQPRA